MASAVTSHTRCVEGAAGAAALESLGGAALAGSFEAGAAPAASAVARTAPGAGVLDAGTDDGGRDGRAPSAASGCGGGELERREGGGGGVEGRDTAAGSLLAPRAELGADAAAVDDGSGDSERRRRLLSQTGVKNPER